MRRSIKAHLVNRSNRPVYRSKPVTHVILNLDLNSNRPVNRSNRPVYRYEPVELSFLNSNLNSTGFRPNRTNIPVPDSDGLASAVGKLNPGHKASSCQPRSLPHPHSAATVGSSSSSPPRDPNMTSCFQSTRHMCAPLLRPRSPAGDFTCHPAYSYYW